MDYVEEALKRKIWAVVGATARENKFGYKIYKNLKHSGYTVYPVNPKYDLIDGDECYDSLTSLPVVPEVVDMVVSPKIGYNFINDAAKLGVDIIWFQPGAESDDLIKKSKDLGLKVIYNTCAMMENNKRK